MENFFLEAVVAQLRAQLPGASPGRIWQPADRLLVIDFRLSDSRLCVIDTTPSDPGLYLSSVRPQSLESSPVERAFSGLLRKHLRSARLETIEKPTSDRIVSFRFSVFESSGELAIRNLVVHLTGRSANAWLVDGDASTLGSLAGDVPVPKSPAPLARADNHAVDLPKTLAVVGLTRTLRRELDHRSAFTGRQEALDSLQRDLAAPVTAGYVANIVENGTTCRVLATFPLQVAQPGDIERFPDVSAAAEAYYANRDATDDFAARLSGQKKRLSTLVSRNERAQLAVRGELDRVEDAARLRELAESLLAQATTARRTETGFAFTDYYSEAQAEAHVEADRGVTPQQAAEQLFARQRKAKRTAEKASSRLSELVNEHRQLEEIQTRLSLATSEADLASVQEAINTIAGIRSANHPRPTQGAKTQSVTGARRFVSSDGLEILVGRSSTANDTLTFKIAKSSDMWLHAADYPGSHVVIRNPSRKGVPHRTLVEAAQLAAFYSEARNQAIVDVRYTERKFVSKPRGASPGLVRLARFKSLGVRPAADLDRAT